MSRPLQTPHEKREYLLLDRAGQVPDVVMLFLDLLHPLFGKLDPLGPWQLLVGDLGNLGLGVVLQGGQFQHI